MVSKYLGTLGFLISAVTCGLIIAIYYNPDNLLVQIAELTFVISIILRGLAWILLESKSQQYKYTGIAVFVLGAVTILTITGTVETPLLSDLGIAITLPFGAWAAYSLVEFYAYHTLQKKTKWFGFARASLPGIALVLIFVGSIYGGFMNSIHWIIPIAYMILILSSLTAALGFYTLKTRSRRKK
ncbi:MAG: hypothetical protein ACXACA_01600 [Candidatus Ranarchaeia archaeon]|jgi:hypothetical protein